MKIIPVPINPVGALIKNNPVEKQKSPIKQNIVCMFLKMKLIFIVIVIL